MGRCWGYGLIIFFLSGCQPQTPPAAPSAPASSGAQVSAAPPKEFALEGEIISVDKEGKRATIKHKAIEGYMGAMTMSYPIPDEADLEKIKAGDQIKATVYDSEADSRYWVGKIQVGEPVSQ
jgi:Cu/Ag efflux protein CusF